MNSAIEPRQQQDIKFISLLRGVASLLVVWDHLVAGWTDHNHLAFLPLAVSRQYLTQPLAIIQDFGYLGVATFFFVSGFIITHVGRREGQLAFLVKRVLRIYPPLAVSILLIVPIAMYEARASGGQYVFTGYHVGDYLRSFTLWNYFMVPQHAVNGVAWTLAIEVMFYLLCLLMLPLLRAMPVIVSGFMTAFCAVVLLRSHDLGDRFFLFSDVCGHLPLLLLGQATYLLWAGLARFWQFAILGLGNYLVFVLALQQVHTSFFPAANSYGVSTTFAYLLFVIALLAGPRLRLPKVIGFYSTISYSLYLLHGTVGIMILDLMVARIGFVLSLLLAVAVVTLCSYLSWRLVEVPSQKLARKLLKKSTKPDVSVTPWKTGVLCPIGLVAIAIWLLVPVFGRPLSLATAMDSRAEMLDSLVASTTTQSAPVDPTNVGGTLEVADARMITGWGWDETNPQACVQVEVYIDGNPAGVGPANHFREDLRLAGKGDGRHAFLLRSPAVLADGKRHQVSVKVVGANKELEQSPLWVAGN